MARFSKINYNTLKTLIKSSSKESSIYIGCDSKLSGAYTVFGLVVIIHIDSCKGARCFGDKFIINRRMSISERLLKEVDMAIESAFNLYDSIGTRTFEIHLDINGNAMHKSNKILHQATSYVKAQGFDFKIKPNAFASSTAADYLIR